MEMTIGEKVGRRLKVLRVLRGWSQEDVARPLEVQRATVARWETGDRSPSVEIIAALAEVFGVKAGYFFGEDSDPLALYPEAMADGDAQVEFDALAPAQALA